MYLNKVTIIGNLTRDPELKSLPSGVMVCSFSVATNRIFKDKSGTKQEQVEYHNVVSFGKQAETINQYMKRGSQILVEGRLQTRSWEQDGNKRYATEIILESFQFGYKQNTVTKEKNIETIKENINDMLDVKEDTFTSEGFDGEVINAEDIPF